MYSSRATPGTGIPVITQITARLRPWPLATMALQLSNHEVRSLRTHATALPCSSGITRYGIDNYE